MKIGRAAAGATADGLAYQGLAGATRTEALHLRQPGGVLRTVEVHRVVNVATHPELRERVLEGDLHRQPDGSELALPFVYHDPARLRFALVIPPALAHLELKERARLMTELAEDPHPVPAYVREGVTVLGVAELDDYLELALDSARSLPAVTDEAVDRPARPALRQTLVLAPPSESRGLFSKTNFVAGLAQLLQQRTLRRALKESGDSAEIAIGRLARGHRARRSKASRAADAPAIAPPVVLPPLPAAAAPSAVANTAAAPVRSGGVPPVRLPSALWPSSARPPLKLPPIPPAGLKPVRTPAIPAAPQTRATPSGSALAPAVAPDPACPPAGAPSSSPSSVPAAAVPAPSAAVTPLGDISAAGPTQLPAGFGSRPALAMQARLESGALLLFVQLDAKHATAFDEDAELMIQALVVQRRPVVLLSLEGSGRVTARLALDGLAPETRELVAVLQRDFRAQLVLCDGSVARATRSIFAPREGNAAAIALRLERHGDAPESSAEQACERALLDPPKTRDPRWPFTPARGQAQTASRVLAAVEQLEPWIQPERVEQVLVEHGVPKHVVEGWQRRVLLSARSFGIALPESLLDFVVESRLADGKAVWVKAQLAAFKQRQAREQSDLEAEASARNWEQLLGQARALQIEIEPQVRAVAPTENPTVPCAGRE